ncbi:MAG TPA: choice-of-anchor D domain-containing protein [Thermoanaerobaculia bacterium]|nr:choice-of-anchor D domain-containing protein [Thermoanaerobaculia bacterium]
MLVLVWVSAASATAAGATSELALSQTASPAFASPGTNVTFVVLLANYGPDPAPSVVVRDTLPATLTFVSCAVSTGEPCGAFKQDVTAKLAILPLTQSPIGADAAAITIVARVAAGAVPGTVISNTASAMSAASDPNPADNSATASVTVPILPQVTLSPTALDFGLGIVGRDSPPLQVTVTNNGTTPVSVSFPVFSGFFYESGAFFHLPDCFPSRSAITLAPGAACNVHVSFFPTIVGPDQGTMSLQASVAAYPATMLGPVALSGTGHTIAIDPSSVDFGLVRVGSAATVSVGIFNFAPAAVRSITITGDDFTQTGSCVGTLSQDTPCYVAVTFSPSSAIARTGTLTFVDDDLASPQVVSLKGAGTALAVSPAGLDFGFGAVGDESQPLPVTVGNIGNAPLTLGKISASGDFSQKNGCPRTLAPGTSCVVSVVADWKVDGKASGKLSVEAQDPASPGAIALASTGVGTNGGKVFLHYDYMVAPDHTHDPEALAPGAVGRIAAIYKAHGIELIVDPRHTAIPEVETIVFLPAPCDLPGFASFYDLRSAYYKPSNRREHYAIFGHWSANQCGEINRQSGVAELPGQNLVVSLNLLERGGLAPDSLSRIISGTFMHELGHNLGLTHGGGSDNTNFKPNFLSVMNYNYQLTGIPLADVIGSTAFKACGTDADCGDGGLCSTFGPPGSPRLCSRLDYSRQVLPRGGNTPGLLDEGDLNELAGLGSGTTDLFFFDNCDFHLAASDGPVDWDGDGAAGNAHAAADLHYEWDALLLGNSAICPSPYRSRLAGFDEWAFLQVKTRSNSERALAVTQSASEPSTSAPELDIETAMAHHVLWPVRPAAIAIQPQCGPGPAAVTPGSPGVLSVALFGGAGLDAARVDLSSLRFHGAETAAAYLSDINGDGVVDLVAVFETKSLRIRPGAKTARLTGWLEDSQRFVGEAAIAVVAGQDVPCR